MSKAILIVAVIALVMISPFIVAAASGNLGDAPLKPDLDPGIKEDAGDVCVRDTEFMRMNHMQLLKDERTQAVRHGERTDKDSIKKCFSCHEYEKFCEKCHEYNSVQPGCFSSTDGTAGTGGCHATEQPGIERPEGF